MSTTLQVFWLDSINGAVPNQDITIFQTIFTSQRIGTNSWTAQSVYYNNVANPPPNFNPSSDFIDGFSTGVNVEAQATAALPPSMLPLTQNSEATQQLFSVPGAVSPTVVDNSGLPDIFKYFTASQGPYNYPLNSGTWWVVGNMSGPNFNEDFLPPAAMAVYKSTNYNRTTGAGTWARQDQAHEPGANTVAFDGSFDASNDSLRFITKTSSGGGSYTHQLIEFNLTTSLWGSFHSPLVLSLGFPTATCLRYAATSAVTWFFYTYGALDDRLAYFNGATWVQDIVSTTAANASNVTEVVVDPDGITLHTFYHGYYQQVQAGAVLGPAGQFSTNVGLTQAMPGKGCVFTDSFNSNTLSLAYPCDYDPFNDGRLSPAVFIGFPLSNPVFTPEVVHTFANDQATCTYSALIVPPSTLTLACPVSGTAGVVGTPYSKTLVVTGGTAPFTFSIISGSLPPGLTLNASTGVISGTPTTVGAYNYVAQVTDFLGATATTGPDGCPITITSVPLAAACPLIVTATLGIFYSQAIPVSGGTPPYTFALTGGSLPPGLSLNTSTGVISGTPSTAGMYSYTITVTDSAGMAATVTINCSITVSLPCPSTHLPGSG